MKRSKGRRGKGPSRQKKPKAPRKKKSAARQPVRPYQFLNHPADVGFIARGKNRQELFAAAALALCEYGWDLNTVKPGETVRLRVRAATMEDLLFTWLSEVLFLTDAEQWVFKNFKVTTVEQTAPTRHKQEGPPLWRVEGQAQGERFDDKRHRARTYIKAVTYHQLSVKETKAGWQATVYLDV